MWQHLASTRHIWLAGSSVLSCFHNGLMVWCFMAIGSINETFSGGREMLHYSDWGCATASPLDDPRRTSCSMAPPDCLIRWGCDFNIGLSEMNSWQWQGGLIDRSKAGTLSRCYLCMTRHVITPIQTPTLTPTTPCIMPTWEMHQYPPSARFLIGRSDFICN